MSTWLTDAGAFESLFSASPNGIVALDASGRIVDCNPACTLISGYERSYLAGRDIRELTGPQMRAFVDEAFAAAKRGASIRREIDMQRADGSILQGEVSSIPVTGSASEVQLFLIVQDLTDRYKAEQDLSRTGDELARVRHIFQLLFEHNPTVVIAIDLDHRISDVNSAGARISGFTREQIVGHPVYDFVPPSRRDRLRRTLDQVMLGESASFQIDAYDSEGRVIEYQATMLPIVANRKVMGAYGLLEDVTQRMRAERKVLAQREELLDLEHDFRSIFERNPDGMCLISTDGVIQDCNESLARIGRCARERIAGQPFRAFLRGEEAERGWSFFRRALDGELVRFQIGSVRGDKEAVVADITLMPKIVQGLAVGVYCVVQDVTERKLAQRKLELQTQRMRDLYLLATTPEYTDAQVMSTLQTGCRLLGMESGAIVDITGEPRIDMRYDALELFAGDDAELLELAKQVTEHREAVVSCGEAQGPYGSWIASRLGSPGSQQGVLIFFSHTARDGGFEEIDHDTLALMSALVGAALERRRTRSHLRTLAYYDALTGLPNRLLFQERLRDALVDSRGHATGLAVLFFDLDNFKDINDSLGHAMGDRLLQMVAHRLARAVGEAGLVARMGGDEFIVLVRDCESPDQVRTLAERLLHVIDQPFRLEDYEQYITTSIGVAVYPCHGRDDQSLIKNADIAMYQAKDRGGNRFFFYDESLETPLRMRLTQEQDLRRALERRQFVLHFQPIIDVASEKPIAVEALLRWNHPQRGTVFPDAFIPAAESSRLIVPIGEWVIATASRQIVDWAALDGGTPLTIAINISARQFHQPDLCERLAGLLRECGLHPRHVEVEITESMALSDVTHAIETVRKLKKIGARIAVDDFGTGHSSLNYLRRFDVDAIKIDRSFVAGIGTERSDETIVKAIVAMGHSLGLMVVAEGVETREQYEFLRANGCDRVQGYYFSRPLDAESLERLLITRETSDGAG